MKVYVIKNNKTNLDLSSLGNIIVYNIDEDCHKDKVAAKKLLYKWGSPALPLCVIEDGKKTLAVMYSENEVVNAETIAAKTKMLCTS